MIREATIAKIQWGRDGNPWKILKMDDGSSWKGDVGDVVPGTLLSARCKDDPEVSRYGVTWVVEAVLGSAIRGEDAIEQWIAYRLPQVGPERARAIVRRFGDDLWDVLRERPLELCEVAGITEERAREIAEAYVKYEGEQTSAVRLVELGFPMGVALRGSKWLTKHARTLQSVLEVDPYDLMDVDGATFDLTDVLAQRLGMHTKDPRRARAWVRSELEDDLHDGHCYRELRSVIVTLVKWGLNGAQVRELLQASRSIEVTGDKVQLASIARAERTVAGKSDALNRYCDQLDNVGDLELPELPDWLDESQSEAIEGLLVCGVAVMTGGPGTGKTTCLKIVLDALEVMGHSVKLASPTGKAAKRLSEVTEHPATTIHRLLGWTPDGWTHDAANPIPASVVVIDESSMLSIDLAGALFAAVSPDARLLLVGDVDQLPPVGPGQVLHDLIESKKLPVYRLHTTHRQAGESWVIDNARRIIAGDAPDLDEKADFDFIEGDSDEIAASVIDLYRQEPGIQILTPEHRNGAGTIALNLAVQAALNPKSRDKFSDHLKAGDYKIFAGDKVLYTKNNRDLGLVNGDMGVVERVTVTGQKTKVLVKFEAFETTEAPDGRLELEADQARPLTLAYAMTVHKGQGSEWQYVAVVCDERHSSLRRQLLYTGVTRTRDHLVLLGSREAIARACAKPRDTNRRTLLQERLGGLRT